MATATLTPAASPDGRPPRRFTVDEYHKLLEVGILKAADRCELIHGVVVQRPDVNPPHASTASRLSRRFHRMVPDDMVVRTQLPVTLSDSEPHPDVVIARGAEADFDATHPVPRNILLVAEVSDSRLADDKTEMYRMYAAARLPVYWILNIPDRRVEVYTHPRGGKNPTYRERADYAPGDDVPVVVGGTELGRIPVNDLLP